MSGMATRVYVLLVLAGIPCAGCSKMPGAVAPTSRLIKLSRGDIGTGESIAAPPPVASEPRGWGTRTSPSYYDGLSGRHWQQSSRGNFYNQANPNN